MLNVQQVRLRFISARLLTSVPSISKGLRKGASTVPLFSKALAGGYPFRCCAQINPQRIKDTPAVNLCSRLVPAPSISKGLRKKLFRTAMDGGEAKQQRRFCTAKTRVQKLTRRSIFELATDGGGSTQQQVFREKNLSLNSVHGRTLFTPAKDGGGSMQ